MLQIEVGKKYRTRSGDVVEIIDEDENDEDMPYLGRFQNCEYITSFARNGRWLMQEESENDLIEELSARCPHCNDSGGVEIGEYEYATCPCVFENYPEQ